VFSYAFSRQNQPGRLKLSDLMIASIRNFINTGSPRHCKLDRTWDRWPASLMIDADDRHIHGVNGRRVKAAGPQPQRPGVDRDPKPLIMQGAVMPATRRSPLAEARGWQR
jgi:hypothetical protein